MAHLELGLQPKNGEKIGLELFKTLKTCKKSNARMGGGFKHKRNEEKGWRDEGEMRKKFGEDG